MLFGTITGGSNRQHKMLKYTLIYLWIYIGIHGAVQVEVEAGDADEHVHIKLHMPKTAVRKSLHRNHVRHKKNPPPYAPTPSHATPHGYAATVTGPGTSMQHSQHSVFHEAPHHNYLTAMETQSLHGLHHHMKTAPTTMMTHLQGIEGVTENGGQQQMLDAQYYGSGIGTQSTGAAAAELGGLLGDTNGGDYMAYLTKSFASFPQPTFETEIIASPMANGDQAYQQVHDEEEEEEQDYHKQNQQHYTKFKHSHRQPYDMAAASVVAAGNHELDEDNEILGPLGRTSSLMEQSEWTPQHPAKHSTRAGGAGVAGLSSAKKALKNEHLLRHVMQQQQQQQDLYLDVENDQHIPSAARQRSRNHYRDDKLNKEALENARDDAMEVMNTYEDMDLDAFAHRDKDDSRYRDMGAGDDGGIKPLTVDDIWSQLQRTYLNKYTPQAQPNEMHDEVQQQEESTAFQPSRKQKRNSQKIKTRKRQYQSKAATPTAAASTVRTLSYENNYYNQELQGKPSTFYDSHTPQSSSYGTSYAAFSPFSLSYSAASSASSPTERDLFSTRATSATGRPSYQNFKAFSNFDDTAAAGAADGDDNTEDEDDAFASSDDVSSEESVFSTSHKTYGNNRSHRHNHGSVAYGHADTLNNNPFNYHDLYASYSTPIAQATIATHPNYQASTYHPNAYNVAGPTPSSSSPSAAALSAAFNSQTPQQQQQAPYSYPTGHESTSYQWREQQHYPASYQSYHTSSSHHQPHQQRTQQQEQQQQQQQHLQQPHSNTQEYQPQTSSALRLPKATVASTSSASLSHNQYHHHQHHPLATVASSSSSPTTSLLSSPLSPIQSSNDFTSAVKQTSSTQQQRNKKRKNRLKSKRNRIVVI